MGYETSLTALAPGGWGIGVGQEPELDTWDYVMFISKPTGSQVRPLHQKTHMHSGLAYLEDGIHDAAERSVVGEFCYSEYVKTPLV